MNSGHKVEEKKENLIQNPIFCYEIAIVHAFYAGKRVLVPCCI